MPSPGDRSPTWLKGPDSKFRESEVRFDEQEDGFKETPIKRLLKDTKRKIVKQRQGGGHISFILDDKAEE